MSSLETARCARVNLNNLFSVIPSLEINPLGVALRMQINECISGLEAAEFELIKLRDELNYLRTLHEDMEEHLLHEYTRANDAEDTIDRVREIIGWTKARE